MLKQRVITASILAPLVLMAVLLLPHAVLILLLAGVSLLAGGEWARLAGTTRWPEQGLFLLFLATAMLALYALSSRHVELLMWILAANLLWWIVVMLRLSRFTADDELHGINLYQMLEGVIVLVPAWLALVFIHRLPQDGPLLLVFLLLLIWIADIGAFFFGRRWGRNRLAPRVSPGKTWEGVFGALAGAMLCGLILAWWRGWETSNYPLAMLVCVSTVMLSVVGDLFVSMLKRERGMKDSGSMLPGHGGLLDRIDSLTAAAPLFLFALMLLGETP